MLQEFLKKSWSEIMNSDYNFKSNTFRHVIEISGSEIIEGDDSHILVYYNTYTQMPMIVLQHYDRGAVAANEIEGYCLRVDEGVVEGGKEFTEIIYLSEDFKTALDK